MSLALEHSVMTENGLTKVLAADRGLDTASMPPRETGAAGGRMTEAVVVAAAASAAEEDHSDAWAAESARMEGTGGCTVVACPDCSIADGIAAGRRADCMGSCRDCMPAARGDSADGDSGCSVACVRHLEALPAYGGRSSPCRLRDAIQFDLLRSRTVVFWRRGGRWSRVNGGR